MDRPDVMKAHGACASQQGTRAFEIDFLAGGIHGAAKIAVGGVVIPCRPLVRAGHHHQRAIFQKGVVQHHAHRQHVVIGMGIEGPVLMPFHRRAMIRLLEIDLGGLQPHAGRTQQLFQDRHHGLVVRQLPEQRRVAVRQLDAADLGILRRVAGLQVIDIGVFADAGGIGHQLVERRAGPRQHVGIQHIRYDQIAGLVIAGDILFGDHILLPLG